MLKLIKKIFGTAQSRKINKFNKWVQKINDWESQFQKLSDSEIRQKTQEFKNRYKNGETLDDLLPEAYAVIKNVCRRLLGTDVHVSGYTQKWDMIPYDVQLIGAIALHNGCVAEMQTGEGKTLTAVLPLYLNSLTSEPVHLVTVNDYLVKRDCEWVGSILRWLGITCGALTNDLPTEKRKQVYQCDVVYGTASEFGFDYLRDNSMSMTKSEQVQRGYYYAIVDEIDSILIDEARTPLIISGPVAQSQQLYHELKDSVSQIVKVQRDLCNRLATEAKKLIEQSGYEIRSDEEQKKPTKANETLISQALEKLWIVSKGTPHNKVLKRILEDPDLREKLDALDTYYYHDQNKETKHKLLSELFVIVDERASEYELTDKGITFWSEYANQGSFDDFTMLDLGPLYAEIEQNNLLTPEQKIQRKIELQEMDAKRKERSHNLRQLLRAHLLMEKDVDYIVQDDAIVIIDENTGRPQPGRRFSDGLHQAIEAKEDVEIQKETQTYATITLQNYFRLYKKLAGMTGTAMTEAGEFKEIYKLDVLEIPTHVPCVRKDSHDEIYMTEREKYNAILNEIKSVHEKGRPILIGTESVEISEKLSRILKVNKLPHTVLNARYHEKEAEIIAFAGKTAAITIATNMAGRGTDIKLEPQVVKAGGLHVIGTCRHQSRRVDRQLRGRCARQGDPGTSKFYVSFEDQLMRRFASPKLNAMIKRFRPPEGEAISASILNRSIETAQKRIEQRNYMIRKHTLEYDDVINMQRREIYRFRNEILSSTDATKEIRFLLSDRIAAQVEMFFNQKSSGGLRNIQGLINWLLEHFPIHFEIEELQALGSSQAGLEKYLIDKIEFALTEKLNLLDQKTQKLFANESTSSSHILNQALQNLMIQTLDRFWQEHLLTVDHLRSEVSLKGVVGQKDPLVEFKEESFRTFEKMIRALDLNILTGAFKLDIISPYSKHVSLEEMLAQLNFQTQQSFLPDLEGTGEQEEELAPIQGQTITSEPQTKRNEPCPCGSGKKHKKCCG